jgi:dTDP-4-amino-4,6-dideoxygalactose transaminase
MMENIPLVDLKAQYLSIQAEVDAAIARTISATAFIRGPEVEHFEHEFATWCTASGCAAVGSGTEALYLSLRALGIGSGHEVITTPHTFIATTEAITLTGARPVFVDICADTANLDPEQLPGVYNERTRAILPVHLNGHPAAMQEILTFARQHSLAVVEDAAQAHGAIYQGNRAGTLGDLGCFSFFPGKNLGAYGDAGAVVSNNPDLIGVISKISNHGRSRKYLHEVEGFNFRMDGLQAAILCAKLPHLNNWISARRILARRYCELLANIPEIILPVEKEGCQSAWHLFVIRIPRRDAALDFLQQEGIQAGVHYPVPLHLQPAYRYLGYHEGSFPITEQTSHEILSLPIYPELTREQQDKVVAALKSFFLS